jgi:hypothetical protein
MASSSKQRTTTATLNRETAVPERCLRTRERKDARKLAATLPRHDPGGAPTSDRC